MNPNNKLTSLALNSILAQAPERPGELVVSLLEHEHVNNPNFRVQGTTELGTLQHAKYFAVYKHGDQDFRVYEVSQLSFTSHNGAQYPGRIVGYKQQGASIADEAAAKLAAVRCLHDFQAAAHASIVERIGIQSADARISYSQRCARVTL